MLWFKIFLSHTVTYFIPGVKSCEQASALILEEKLNAQ